MKTRWHVHLPSEGSGSSTLLGAVASVPRLPRGISAAQPLLQRAERHPEPTVPAPGGRGGEPWRAQAGSACSRRHPPSAQAVRQQHRRSRAPSRRQQPEPAGPLQLLLEAAQRQRRQPIRRQWRALRHSGPWLRVESRERLRHHLCAEAVGQYVQREPVGPRPERLAVLVEGKHAPRALPPAGLQ